MFQICSVLSGQLRKFPSAVQAFASFKGKSERLLNELKSNGGLFEQGPFVLRAVKPDDYKDLPMNEEDRQEELSACIKNGQIFKRGIGIPLVKCSDAQCTQGLLRYSMENFYLNNSDHPLRCIHCCNRIRSATISKLDQQEDFLCSVCNVRHPNSMRVKDRNVCLTEHNKQRSESASERAKHIDKEKVIGKECIHCHKDFDPENFRWKQTRWSSECKECYNRKKYHTAQRERRKNEDIFAYLEACRQQQKARRRDHPEECEEYNRKRRLEPMFKIRTYIRRAAAKGIVFLMEDVEDMAKLLTENCHYCGAAPTSHSLNGLDRLEVDYNMETVVPCCSTCNMMVYKEDPCDFLRRMTIWNEVRIGKGESVNMNLLAESKMCSLPKKQVLGRKAGLCNVKLEDFCYLCLTNTKLGIDRVNSDLPYDSLDNCRACCWTCNNMKKDFSYDACMAHAARVCQHQQRYNNNNESMPVLYQNKKRKTLLQAYSIGSSAPHAQVPVVLLRRGEIVKRFDSSKQLCTELGFDKTSVSRSLKKGSIVIDGMTYDIVREKDL